MYVLGLNEGAKLYTAQTRGEVIVAGLQPLSKSLQMPAPLVCTEALVTIHQKREYKHVDAYEATWQRV